MHSGSETMIERMINWETNVFNFKSTVMSNLQNNISFRFKIWFKIFENFKTTLG